MRMGGPSVAAGTWLAPRSPLPGACVPPLSNHHCPTGPAAETPAKSGFFCVPPNLTSGHKMTLLTQPATLASGAKIPAECPRRGRPSGTACARAHVLCNSGRRNRPYRAPLGFTSVRGTSRGQNSGTALDWTERRERAGRCPMIGRGQRALDLKRGSSDRRSGGGQHCLRSGRPSCCI